MASAQSMLLLAVYVLLITEFILAERDYYDTLGVPKDASERQIKKAFHRLALKYHPDRDKSPGAEAKFREIAEAYETLSDDKRRRQYDQFGHGGGEEGEEGGSYDFHQHFQSFNFNFEDMFKDFEPFRHQHQHQHQHQHHSHPHPKRHFDGHFQAHQEATARHQRQFSGGGVFDDVFEDLEEMFSFGAPGSGSRSGFQGSGKRHCRTVTQRQGNMVTTFTKCS